METLWIVIGALVLLVGFAGCLLPIIPGPPVAYFSLIALQITDLKPFSTNQLVIWALIVTCVTVLDYVVPIYGTKKFGGTKYGVWGSTIGLLIGLVFMGPFGIIIGPFVGALVGELISGQSSNKALKAAFGSFVGFLAGVMAKFAVVIGIAYYFIRALI